ncbi:MAG TPA: 50S ribosomal protein L5 [Candidatus Kapabacteria bacterium]|nr:50S ribosomal protein L5 [Candidatus Kapabacteria bacterium]
MESTLKQQYMKEIVPALKKELGYANVMQVPKLVKVTLNVGYGRHTKDAAYIERVTQTLALVTGQKPVHNKAKKSISNFKTRQGMPIGVSVTLRGTRMYEFIYKFVNLVLPRVRDFRGLSPKSFDREGNYSLGLKENIAFPEITSYTIDGIHGLQVVIHTTAKNKEEGTALLKKLGFPFRDK